MEWLLCFACCTACCGFFRRWLLPSWLHLQFDKWRMPHDLTSFWHSKYRKKLEKWLHSFGFPHSWVVGRFMLWVSFSRFMASLKEAHLCWFAKPWTIRPLVEMKKNLPLNKFLGRSLLSTAFYKHDSHHNQNICCWSNKALIELWGKCFDISHHGKHRDV